MKLAIFFAVGQVLSKFCLLSPTFAQVESDRVSISQVFSLGEYSATIEQLPSSAPFGDYTGVWFDIEYVGGLVTITGRSTLLDEGSDWYFVHAGDSFGRSSIAAGEFGPFIETSCDGCITEFNSVSFSPAIDFASGLEDGPNDFYLGFATTNFPPRNTYGWAKLEFNPLFPTEFVLVDSRTAYNSHGIIVGTSTTIPEPTTAVGYVLCSIAMAIWRPLTPERNA